MIELTIPGRGVYKLEYLVCDVNGTLAVDGSLIDGVHRAITRLSDRLTIYLVTANTHGKQAQIDQYLGVRSTILTTGEELAQKADFVRQLGAERVIAIGQGANDAGMLKEAAIGISVLSKEGTAVSALFAADIVVADVLTAFELIEKPIRMVATLRL